MELARVVGQVVATVKQQGLHSMKLLILTPVGTDGQDEGEFGAIRRYVAVDYAGAGTGEVVLVATGGAARTDNAHIPTDAAVVAIVDSVVLDSKTTYRSGG